MFHINIVVDASSSSLPQEAVDLAERAAPLLSSGTAPLLLHLHLHTPLLLHLHHQGETTLPLILHLSSSPSVASHPSARGVTVLDCFEGEARW